MNAASTETWPRLAARGLSRYGLKVMSGFSEIWERDWAEIAESRELPAPAELNYLLFYSPYWQPLDEDKPD